MESVIKKMVMRIYLKYKKNITKLNFVFSVPSKKTAKTLGSKRLPKKAEKKAFGYVLRNLKKGKNFPYAMDFVIGGSGHSL